MKRISEPEVERLIRTHTEEVRSDRLCGDPVVSVALVTFNHGRFIREALESVVGQVTMFPHEVVVGDDASDDGTKEVVEEYQHRYPERIRIVRSTDNLGKHTGSGRINFMRTIQACRGKYVALLEGDDYWTCVDKLQRQVEFLESDASLALCHHRVEHVTALGDPLRISPYPFGRKRIGFRELLQGLSNPIYTGSIVYRRNGLPRLPEAFLNFRLADWPIAMLLLQQGDAILIDEVMSRYRVHGGGLWSKKHLSWRSWQKLRMIKKAKQYFAPRETAAFDALEGKLRWEVAEGLKRQGHAARARALRGATVRRHVDLLPWYCRRWCTLQIQRARRIPNRLGRLISEPHA